MPDYLQIKIFHEVTVNGEYEDLQNQINQFLQSEHIQTQNYVDLVHAMATVRQETGSIQKKLEHSIILIYRKKGE